MSNKNATIVLGFLLMAFLVFIILSNTFPSGLGGLPFRTVSNTWTIALIEELGLQLPNDALNIRYEGRPGVGGEYGYRDLLELQFQAPRDSSEVFLQGICNGILHQGFDPFNSEVVRRLGDIDANTLIIHMGLYSHYARSNPELETLAGNRCFGGDQWGYIHEVAVDKTDPSIYEINFRRIDYRDLYGPVEQVNPVNDGVLPIRVLGIIQKQGENIAMTPEICIETYQEQMWPLGNALEVIEPIPEFVNATVEILIDDTIEPLAVIDENQSLQPQVQNTKTDFNSMYWNYCLNNDWNVGNHRIAINISTVSGDSFSYQWDFRVEGRSETES